MYKNSIKIQLVVSTHLKNISQIGSFPQIGMKIKNIWNHHPEIVGFKQKLPTFWPSLFTKFVEFNNMFLIFLVITKMPLKRVLERNFALKGDPQKKKNIFVDFPGVYHHGVR